VSRRSVSPPVDVAVWVEHHEELQAVCQRRRSVILGGGGTSMKPPTKPPAKPPTAEVRCQFCGRRNTVRRVDDKLYFCSHCDKMFQR
jgi:hypothetical protein